MIYALVLTPEIGVEITDLQSYKMATDNSMKAHMEALEIRIENRLYETLNNFKKKPTREP